MYQYRALAVACALSLSACTSMRVSGYVADAETSRPIDTCGVSFGSYYTHTDSAGHFVIKGRNYWKSVQLIAPGYQPQSLDVQSMHSRTPTLNIQMVPLRASAASTATRETASSRKPE